jgi:tRNA G18 (ribose-2'-O)-methylase SpoU
VSVVELDAFPKDVVLLFGSKRFGTPRELLSRASVVVGIPLYGVNHSLPLAIAAAIVMNEWARRRYVPGSVA